MESAADILGYGGAAGGGKTDLLLGLAGWQHWRSIIFRREFPRLDGIIERSREVYNAEGASHAKDSYNENLHRWQLHDGRIVRFAAMQYEGDKKNYQGRPHDLYGFDEVTEFAETQVRFVIAWNRSTHINPATGKPQRCRVVMTFNPPFDESGDWVTRYFLPWLAYLYPDQYQHPRPAAPGELRYYATVNGADVEVPESRLRWYAVKGGKHWEVADGEPFTIGKRWIVPVRGYEQDGKLVQVKSRTFIPASLADNPILEATGYGATIDALPEPLRSLLKGNFAAARVADPWQVIPSAWVRKAQARWRERAKPDVPLQAMGVDPVRGGDDQFTIAKLYGTWCAPIEAWPGAVVPDGPAGAALVVSSLGGVSGIPIGVDIIGYGSTTFDSLVASGIEAMAINNSESAGDARDRSGKFKFRNVRAASYWAVREALDPEHGDDMALPDDPELLADLCAPRFRVTSAGIQIRDKEEIREQIGRSPDKGDALVLAHWALLQGAYQPGI